MNTSQPATACASEIAASMTRFLAEAGLRSVPPLACCHELAHAAQIAAVQAAGAGTKPLFLLWGGDHFWIGPSAAPAGCIRCFQLWTTHRWTERLAVCGSPPADPPRLPAAMIECLASLAAAFLMAAAARPHSTARIRFVGSDMATVEDHALTPHPDCRFCCPAEIGAPDAVVRTMRRPLPPAPAAAWRAASAADLTSRIVPLAFDRRCGLVRKIERTTLRLTAIAAASVYPSRTPAAIERGFGRSGRRTDDTGLAVVEALERYAGTLPRERTRIVRGSYAGLADRAIDPRHFILPAPDQRSGHAHADTDYHPQRRYDWVWAYSFRRDDAVLVPLQLAYHGAGALKTVEGGCFAQEVSNGAAAGATLREAAFHGLLEVVERDAFLTNWYARRAVSRVSFLEGDDPHVHAVAARLSAEGATLEVLDVGADIPVACLAVRITHRRSRTEPAVLFAAAAHVDPARALRAALAEATTMIGDGVGIDHDQARARGRALLADPSLVRTMADHVDQGWPNEAIERCAFAIAPGEKAWRDIFSPFNIAGPHRLDDALSQLVGTALATCHDVLVVDQSFEPYAGNRLAFAKVLAPGLLPMTFGHANRRVSMDRLARVAGDGPAGHAPATCAPHPFA